MEAKESRVRYTGPERRRGEERRAKPDRRAAIRWEPNKEERRNGGDRRRLRTDIWNGSWDR